MVDEYVTPEEKAILCSRLVLLAPPCEFNEVLDDVRCIAGDDPQIQKKLAASIAQYNKDQMIHVKLPDREYPTLITSYSDLGDGYFMCPRSQLTFHFDHFKQTVSDVKSFDKSTLDNVDHDLESWRRALEDSATIYVNEHFPDGALAVYALRQHDGARSLILCIESHFSKHQSTGRWRSEWTFRLVGQQPSTEFSVHGVIKVQTHLYEEGNVQLISSKEVDFVVSGSFPKEFANESIKRIKAADCAYQIAVGENFKTMSDTTFKALRRQLPLTRSKLDWNKIITYQIGSELSRAPPN
ncbi:hypothetical protein MN116_004978 [Schistosoma mekongi]|uniref:F-actin-capping protein subunit alpha n=1 Tax=Schistosoma mekongi TaxID=38744 RepID=A0AAE1ZC48_SCHME|nr:hypothetical protein MN116_004978 [Schistosoma mekongi]